MREEGGARMCGERSPPPESPRCRSLRGVRCEPDEEGASTDSSQASPEREDPALGCTAVWGSATIEITPFLVSRLNNSWVAAAKRSHPVHSFVGAVGPNPRAVSLLRRAERHSSGAAAQLRPDSGPRARSPLPQAKLLHPTSEGCSVVAMRLAHLEEEPRTRAAGIPRRG